MKISIDKPDGLTLAEKNLVFKLETSSFFDQRVSEIRSSLSKDSADYKEQLIKKTKELLSELRIPQGWLERILNFIDQGIMTTDTVTNIGIELQTHKGTHKFPVNNKYPSSLPNNVKIVIQRRVTKSQLKQWIEQNWEDLKQAMGTAKLMNYSEPEWEDLDLAINVIKLKDENKLTFTKISDVLCKKYENDSKLFDKVSDAANLKQMYHNYKKYQELSKKYPPLLDK